jgi:hypothetical protein
MATSHKLSSSQVTIDCPALKVVGSGVSASDAGQIVLEGNPFATTFHMPRSVFQVLICRRQVFDLVLAMHILDRSGQNERSPLLKRSEDIFNR